MYVKTLGAVNSCAICTFLFCILRFLVNLQIMTILTAEVQGVEVYFLCLFEDMSVDFVNYRYVLYEYYNLYKKYNEMS